MQCSKCGKKIPAARLAALLIVKLVLNATEAKPRKGIVVDDGGEVDIVDARNRRGN